MRTDLKIQTDVVAELRWEPSLRDDDIAVGVRDGVSNLITARVRPTPSGHRGDRGREQTHGRSRRVR